MRGYLPHAPQNQVRIVQFGLVYAVGYSTPHEAPDFERPAAPRRRRISFGRGPGEEPGLLACEHLERDPRPGGDRDRGLQGARPWLPASIPDHAARSRSDRALP